MNFAMRRTALNVIPDVSKTEWDELDVISKWLISTRAAVLVMTFISAALAGIFALLVVASSMGGNMFQANQILPLPDIIGVIKGPDNVRYKLPHSGKNCRQRPCTMQEISSRMDMGTSTSPRYTCSKSQTEALSLSLRPSNKNGAEKWRPCFSICSQKSCLLLLFYVL